jgi:hypothetical protein
MPIERAGRTQGPVRGHLTLLTKPFSTCMWSTSSSLSQYWSGWQIWYPHSWQSRCRTQLVAIPNSQPRQSCTIFQRCLPHIETRPHERHILECAKSKTVQIPGKSLNHQIRPTRRVSPHYAPSAQSLLGGSSDFGGDHLVEPGPWNPESDATDDESSEVSAPIGTPTLSPGLRPRSQDEDKSSAPQFGGSSPK